MVSILNKTFIHVVELNYLRELTHDPHSEIPNYVICFRLRIVLGESADLVLFGNYYD